MSTYGERWLQAHKHAVELADAAYDGASTPAAKYDAYHRTYTREMDAFRELEAMRNDYGVPRPPRRFDLPLDPDAVTYPPRGD